MNRAIEIWNSSILGRVLTAICLWFSGQWQRSRVVRAFVAPMAGRQAAESSVFFRLWDLIRGGLCALYRRLGLERLFGGSIFLCLTLWCSAAVVLAPLLPTMAVLALAAVAFASLALNLVRDRARPLAYSPVNRYILLYAAVYLAATATSVTPRQSLFPGLLMVFFMAFALVVENAVDSWERAEQLVFLMVLAGGVVALLGVGQYVLGATGDAAWVDSDMFSSVTIRVYSTLQNPNVLAEYLILMISLGGAALLTAKGTGKRLVLLACCGVMCLCMVLTMSRGGWLGLLIAGMIFLVLLNPRVLVLAPVVLPVALVALYFVLPDTVISRFTSIGNLEDTSTSYRVSIWMGTIAMLKDYWLCGIGPGTGAFNLVYPAYSYNAANAQHAHNLFLQIMSDGGVVALVVFLLTKGILWLLPHLHGADGPQTFAASAYDSTGYLFDADDARLVLVNANLPFDKEPSPTLDAADEAGTQLEAEAAQQYRSMAEAAQADGITLTLVTGYQDADTRTAAYEAQKQTYLARHKSEEEASARAAAILPEADANEHGTGYAADILSTDYTAQDTGFADTRAYQWLTAYAAEYGFILRYPEDRQAITGVVYEPWHWRYVGVENALAIRASGLSLEEFLAEQKAL